jgi:Ca2+-binding EF-hand superfamily protein
VDGNLAGQPPTAYAQDSDRRDRDRGDRDRGERRRYDPKEFIGRIDENGNGILEPSEMGGRSRYFLEGAARDAGLDMSRDIPVAKMIEAMEKRNAAREATNSSSGSTSPTQSGSSTAPPATSSSSSDSGYGGGRSGFGGSSSSTLAAGSSTSSSSGGSKGGFPGFGAPPSAAKPPGFDVPLPPKTAGNASSSATQYDRRVIEYVDKMMVDYDLNKDGVLDKAEIEKAPWQSDPKESDLNKDGRLDREELNQRIARRFGYLPRTTSTSSSSSSGGGSSGGSSSGSGDAARVRAYAEGLLKQNDVNKNGVLDKDEWTNVRSITRDTDANNDGTVTLDELTAKLGSYGRDEKGSSSGGSSSSTASSSGGSSSGSSGYRSSSGSGYGSSRGGDSKQTGEKRSYRQRTVAERMPKGLPDWFARNDEDADGQITMAEYATLWNDSKVAEFAKFDLDGDGVITPRECLRSQELETKRK